MHTLTCIGRGLMTGLILSLMLGTVFFSLIRNSIIYGHKTGIYIALGVVICDIIFITLALLSQPFADFLNLYKRPISIGGGILLTIMGIWMLIQSNPKIKEGKELQEGNAIYYIGNGFLLNALNPVNFFSWLVVSSYLTIEYDYTLTDKSIFFTACLISIFIAEVGIAASASKLRKWVTPNVLKRINQVSALVFVGFGLKLVLGLWSCYFFPSPQCKIRKSGKKQHQRCIVKHIFTTGIFEVQVGIAKVTDDPVIPTRGIFFYF